MLFRRIIFSAIFIGILAGLIFTAVQSFSISPIIFAAEKFEISAPEPVVQAHHHEAGANAHHHDAEAWGPEDGTERALYTMLSNVLAGIGFSAVLLALMSQLQIQGITKLSLIKGFAWGLAGFIAFFAIPGIGLPPEIPGIEAPPLENRQSWWLLAVIASGVGLAILAFAKGFLKLVGLFFIALPYLVGAPHSSGPEFAHPDAAAVATLIDLHHQFIVASGISNLLFWLVIGGLSAWVLNRKILTGQLDSGHAPV